VISTIYIVPSLAFLDVLNGFLRGTKKAQIDAALSVLLIGLEIFAFFIAGWKFGLLAIAVASISAIITRPIAARLASKLLSESSDSEWYVGLPPGPLQTFYYTKENPK